MDMEFGKACKVTHILENGVTLKQRDMVFTTGKVEIVMKESGNSA